MKDANGLELNVNDRVKTFEFGGWVEGIICKNEHPKTKDKFYYSTKWDDGEETLLLDSKELIKIINQ